MEDGGGDCSGDPNDTDGSERGNFSLVQDTRRAKESTPTSSQEQPPGLVLGRSWGGLSSISRDTPPSSQDIIPSPNSSQDVTSCPVPSQGKTEKEKDDPRIELEKLSIHDANEIMKEVNGYASQAEAALQRLFGGTFCATTEEDVKKAKEVKELLRKKFQYLHTKIRDKKLKYGRDDFNVTFIDIHNYSILEKIGNRGERAEITLEMLEEDEPELHLQDPREGNNGEDHIDDMSEATLNPIAEETCQIPSTKTVACQTGTARAKTVACQTGSAGAFRKPLHQMKD